MWDGFPFLGYSLINTEINLPGITVNLKTGYVSLRKRIVFFIVTCWDVTPDTCFAILTALTYVQYDT